MPLGAPDPKEMGRLLTLAQVGLEMVVPVGLGIGLDYYLNWKPWGSVGGAVGGLAIGLMHLFILTKAPPPQSGSSQQSRDSQ